MCLSPVFVLLPVVVRPFLVAVQFRRMDVCQCSPAWKTQAQATRTTIFACWAASNRPQLPVSGAVHVWARDLT